MEKKKKKKKRQKLLRTTHPIFYVPSPFDPCTFSGTFSRRRLFQGFSFPIGMPRRCQDKLSEAFSPRGKTRGITCATTRVCRSFLKMFNGKNDENSGRERRKKLDRSSHFEARSRLPALRYDEST